MKNKLLIIFLSSFLLFFLFNFFSPINLDVIWNYGFSLNFSKGLILYKDYNMVITPLYPIVVGSLMKIFGNGFPTFYIINALFASLIILIVYKLDKTIIMPFILVLLLASEPNYDLLSTLFIFLLIYYEKENKNDYLIGLIIGLSFLTKSSVGFALSIPSIVYLKIPNKVLKRIVGFLIPNILIILYFLLKKNLYNYINYAFLGLFDFAGGNGTLNPLTILSLIILCFFIYKYIRTKNIEHLYIGLFQIVNIPLFNISHFIESLIPVWYYLFKSLKRPKKYYKYATFLLIIPIIMLIYNIIIKDCHYINKPFNTKYLQQEYIDDINSLDSYFNNNYENVHFIMYESYLYNIILNRNIDIYSLPLKGNLGYNGEANFIKQLSKLEQNSIIVTSMIFQEGQSSEKIYNYINDNYSIIAQFRKFNVYIKN